MGEGEDHPGWLDAMDDVEGSIDWGLTAFKLPTCRLGAADAAEDERDGKEEGEGQTEGVVETERVGDDGCEMMEDSRGVGQALEVVEEEREWEGMSKSGGTGSSLQKQQSQQDSQQQQQQQGEGKEVSPGAGEACGGGELALLAVLSATCFHCSMHALKRKR